MGKTLNKNEIIDETFAGLLNPSEVHELGREDITSGRPGEILLEIVKDFGHEGFKKIATDRAAEREKLEAPDERKEKKILADFGMNDKKGKSDNDLSISDEKS